MDARAVHYCVYAANDYAPWSKAITLVSPEWSPEDEAKATKACTNKAGQVRLHNNNTSNHPSAHSAALSPFHHQDLSQRVDSVQGKTMLMLAYKFMRFRKNDVVRPMRLADSGWFLWHEVSGSR